MGAPADGLKARNMTAQGNALGKTDRTISCPEGAWQNQGHGFVSALLGPSFGGAVAKALPEVFSTTRQNTHHQRRRTENGQAEISRLSWCNDFNLNAAKV
jgi:hypothetical protein